MTHLRPQQTHDLTDGGNVEPLRFSVGLPLLLELSAKARKYLGLEPLQILAGHRFGSRYEHGLSSLHG
jgi:hypothetical protein